MLKTWKEIKAMNNILMQEEYIEVLDKPLDNGITSLLCGDSGVLNLQFTSIKEVFAYCQASPWTLYQVKCYVEDKEPKAIGWVFETSKIHRFQ